MKGSIVKVLWVGILACGAGLVACGDDAPSKKESAVVVVVNNGSNNTSNNANNTSTTNNVSNNDACCNGRVCGSAPECVDVVCGVCTEQQFCTESGSCEALAADAPRILDLSSNTTRVTPSTEFIVTAIVTDPDGIDDLIGGSLKAPSGATYGAFQTSAAEGSYQITISWSQINAVQAIVFDTSAQRDLVAEFFDQSGNKVQRTLSITLACDDSNEAACEAGRCIDLNSSEDHCGSCGNALSPSMDTELYCSNGQPTCGDGTYCSQTQVCATDWEPKACGSCNNNCETRATAANLNLSHPDSQVLCDQGSQCSAYIVSTTRVSCETICGPNAECWSSSASFSESGISADCATNWADAQWDDYGTFLQVNCDCRF